MLSSAAPSLATGSSARWRAARVGSKRPARQRPSHHRRPQHPAGGQARRAAEGFGAREPIASSPSLPDDPSAVNGDDDGDTSGGSTRITDASTRSEASREVLALIDRLLPDGRDVNHRDPGRGGETALTVRAEAGDARDVRALLAMGADPNAASDTAWTPMHGAAECGSVEVIDLLASAGADVNAVARSGKTPLDIARQYERPAAMEALVDRGAVYGVYADDDKDDDAVEAVAEDDGVGETSDDAASDEGGGWRGGGGRPALEALLAARGVGAGGDAQNAPPLTVDDVETVYDFPLDEFQRAATRVLVEGDSVVVSAPTGSGKTLVGETAIIAALARGQKAIYTTPLKALSNQKLREFQALFGTRRVGLKTGDVDINAADADVVVMTTEILRNMLYPSAADTGGQRTDEEEGVGLGASIGELGGVSDGRLDNVGVVVLDEVHYLADQSRGTVWEETIIYCPPRIQLLCLSATVGNPDDLAGWIEECRGGRRCETIVSDYRPVPLNWHFSMKPGRMWPGLGPLLNRKGSGLHHELFPFTKEGVREWEAANGGRGNWEWGVSDDDDGDYDAGFYRKRQRGGRRQGGDRSRGRGGGGRGGGGWRGARGGSFGGDAPPSPANDRQARRRLVPHVETTVGQLVAADMLPAVWFIFSRRGCDQAAAYLADCGAKLVTPAEEREIARALDAFARDNPDAVRPEAVDPLLLGIASHHAGLLPGWKGLVENLFQRGLLKVVFATETLAAGVNMPARCSVLSALSKRGDSGPRALTSNEFMQMAGRAGRRGYDVVGHVVACQSPFEGPDEAFALVSAPPDNLRSQFSISYGMVLNLLRAGKPLRDVRSIVERSFGNYLGGRARRGQVRELRRLREQADALREQIEAGESIVEPEEWARYLKLDGRLTEERRLLKIVARQTEDALAEAARGTLRDALELGEAPVLVSIATDNALQTPTPSVGRPAVPASQTLGLMPDGSWAMSSSARGGGDDGDRSVGAMIDETFLPEEDEDEEEDAEGDDGEGDSPRGGEAGPIRRENTVAVAVVEAYPAPTLTPERDGAGIGGDRFPLGEFVGLAADGTWHRFAASRVRRVGIGRERGDQSVAAAEPSDWSPGPPPVPSSVRWRRAGDGLWTAEGTDRAAAAAAAAGVAEVDAALVAEMDAAAVDDRQAEEALRFLDEQRAKIAATRAEIAEMKSFSDLRRAVKLSNRRRSKLKKLDERIARVEKRVGEYVAAGWSEFVRVVDILVEEGALYDPIPDEALALEEQEAAEAAAKAAEAAAEKAASIAAKDAQRTGADVLDAIGGGDWEPDEVSPLYGAASFSMERLDDLYEYGEVRTPAVVERDAAAYDYRVERDRRQTRRRMRWEEASGGSERMDETLALTPLGEACAKLRGENELWLGIALSSPALEGLAPEQIAGAAGALCCDANRPVSCDYGPSEALSFALEDLEPEAAELMSMQFEASMDSPVNLSRSVAALVEAWASGAGWDQVRRDTNLEEGDIARVFRRTAELLAQMARTNELPQGTRAAAKTAAKLVLRPPITDLS